MPSGNVDNSKENNILRKRRAEFDDVAVESLKQYYKIKDSEDSELIKYIKGNRTADQKIID